MRHLDINNCHTCLYAYVVCAWETFFVDVIGRYVTMCVVWTSLKSIADFLEREDKISRVADEIMRHYHGHRLERRIINKNTLPVPTGARPIKILGVHLDPLVDLSPCIYCLVGKIQHQPHQGLRRQVLDGHNFASKK